MKREDSRLPVDAPRGAAGQQSSAAGGERTPQPPQEPDLSEAGPTEASGQGAAAGPDFEPGNRIIDFILGQCDATNSQQFVNYWLVTNGYPCLICGRDKPGCPYFAGLVKGGVFTAEGALP
jgi:hypothetical protein